MAFLAVDGYDMYNGGGTLTGVQAKWIVQGSAPSMTAGRFAGQAVRFNGAAANTMDRVFPSTVASLAFGIAFRFSSVPAGSTAQRGHVAFKSGSGFQCGLAIDTAGTIVASRLSGDTSGTVLGSSPSGVWNANVWYYLEGEIVLSTTAGRITLYLNSTQIVNVTGVNTANLGASTVIDTIHLGSNNGGNAPGNLDFDDLYVIDTATKLGECKVETLRAASDSLKTFTPNSGTTNFSRVNETLVDGDTSYVSGTNVGDRDLYGIGALSSTPSNIFAANIVSFAEKTDANTRAIFNSVQSAGTDSDGSQQNLAASYSRFDRFLATDPNGGAAWTAARINGLLIGPKVAV